MPKLPVWFKKFESKKDAIKNLNSKLGKIPNCICQEARCPNRAECFEKGQLTFLILGTICTRNCGYCNVASGKPLLVDTLETEEILRAIEKLKLKFVVLTSPTRDDLSDGGASHYAYVVNEIKAKFPKVIVEVLIPDFNGDWESAKTVLASDLQVFNHNLEVVPSLFSKVRTQADFRSSLNILKRAKKEYPKIFIKTGLMIGLGETKEELVSTFKVIAESKVDILTIGQYLRPNKNCVNVERYYSPEEFEELKEIATSFGIKFVFAGPYIRSSYLAEDFFDFISNEK
jgi:lipoyl synthase